ncbi:hypothetical protein [Paenibacillus sp. CMAA1364]
MKKFFVYFLLGLFYVVLLMPEVNAIDHNHHSTSTIESNVLTNPDHEGITSEGSSKWMTAIYIASLVLVVCVSSYIIVIIHRKGSALSSMTGMVAAMTVAMMGGLVVGTVVGIMLMTMFLSTFIGVVTGATLGYISGIKHSLVATMDGLMSGIMGGMMGAMMGVMVVSDHPVYIVLMMDIVFLILIGLLHQLLHNDIKSSTY